MLSYSEGDRQRFIGWLRTKYGTIEKLNKAWATQRWSRHLNSFEEVRLPYANGPSPPERYLDLYPINPLGVTFGALQIKGDLETPAWFNEFTSGGGGTYGGPKGIIRMWAYLALLDYGQTFLAWTFNTHRGGEEQAWFGLLDHDGTPSLKYNEYKQIASEFSKLQHLGFPRYHKPDVAIAYSFEN